MKKIIKFIPIIIIYIMLLNINYCYADPVNWYEKSNDGDGYLFIEPKDGVNMYLQCKKTDEKGIYSVSDNNYIYNSNTKVLSSNDGSTTYDVEEFLIKENDVKSNIGNRK